VADGPCVGAADVPANLRGNRRSGAMWPMDRSSAAPVQSARRNGHHPRPPVRTRGIGSRIMAGMQPESLTIRLADPDRDGEAVAAIYRPHVVDGLASFEEVAPTAEEMAERMRTTLQRTPWLVAERDGTVIGYAYAGPHHQRAGYRWCVNISVYVAADATGRGIGRKLYDRLLDVLGRQGFVNVYAGITLPNPASVALHEGIGMRRIGVYERVGFKHGAWRDVAWFGLRLAEPEGDPLEPIPLPELGRMDGDDASA
jgi:L-amino acid N-acyltransferase YncA